MRETMLYFMYCTEILSPLNSRDNCEARRQFTSRIVQFSSQIRQRCEQGAGSNLQVLGHVVAALRHDSPGNGLLLLVALAVGRAVAQLRTAHVEPERALVDDIALRRPRATWKQ